MRRDRIFITGGAGFIGSHLAAKLSGRGDIVVFDNLHPQTHHQNPDNLARLTAHGIPVIASDIRDGAALARAVRDVSPDIIFHLAAETGTAQSYDEPARYTDVNVTGTAHLIEAIRQAGGVKRVILASSRAVYGEGSCVYPDGTAARAEHRNADDLRSGDFWLKDKDGRPLRPTATNATCLPAPMSIYASTKLMQEYLLQQAVWNSDTQLGILRLHNVYGPGQSLHNPYTGVLANLCLHIQQNRRLRVFEDGLITRDFVWIDDVVDACARMAEVEDLPQEILDIGSGRPCTILHAAQTLLSLFGKDPDRLAITGEFRPGDIRHAVANIDAAKTVLGWQPKMPLIRGLGELVDWSRNAAVTRHVA